MSAFTFARFDLATWLPRPQTLLPLVLVAAVAVALPVPGMAVVAAALVTSITVSAPFLSDERGRLDTMYGLLPIARSAVVVGRAFTVWAYFVLSLIVAMAATATVAAVRGDAVPTDVLLVAFGAACAIVGLSTTLQLPVLFAIGYARGRLVALAPPFVLAGGAWLAQALDLLDPITRAFAGVPSVGLAGGGVALGVVGLAAGTTLATRTYARREL